MRLELLPITPGEPRLNAVPNRSHELIDGPVERVEVHTAVDHAEEG